MKIKNILKRIIYRERYDSNTFNNYLRKQGATIGENVFYYPASKVDIEKNYTFLINIGNNVAITAGVTLLAHDYSWGVTKGYFGSLSCTAGKVEIGNNCFIGVKTTILAGSKIGNNCIIGACSLVNKEIPDNEVWAGVPAKFIMTIDEYHKRKTDDLIKNAKTLACEYSKKFGKRPHIELFYEFFPLFMEINDKLPKRFLEMLHLRDSFDLSLQYYKSYSRPYVDYEDFLKDCGL